MTIQGKTYVASMKWRWMAVLALVAAPAPAAAPDDATFAAIRAVDVALARIGWRLATANAFLCDRLEPGLGLVLHTPVQYAPETRAAARRFFGLDGPLGVEGVVDGSPAARAGIRPGDLIDAIGPVRPAPDDPRAPAGTAALAAVSDSLAALPPDRPVTVTGRRSDTRYQRDITPLPACRTRFEVRIDPGFPAVADGTLVQIGDRFLTGYPEDQAAAAIAHELAHNILRHRARLEAAGVSFGLASRLGRDAAIIRRTELEADILSVALLANAGYDPAAAIRFWRSFGPAHAGGPFRDPTHPGWRDRIAVMTRAIATGDPRHPAILATRDRPLDGNWRGLPAGS